MNLFIYIEIANFLNLKNQKPIHHWIKSETPSFNTFDFNNFSEINQISHAIRLVNEAENVVILVEFSEKLQPGPVLRFVEAISKQEEKKFYFILNGEHAVIEKMVKNMNNLEFYQNQSEEQQKELLLKVYQGNK